MGANAATQREAADLRSLRINRQQFDEIGRARTRDIWLAVRRYRAEAGKARFSERRDAGDRCCRVIAVRLWAIIGHAVSLQSNPRLPASSAVLTLGAPTASKPAKIAASVLSLDTRTIAYKGSARPNPKSSPRRLRFLRCVDRARKWTAASLRRNRTPSARMHWGAASCFSLALLAFS
jgi:hypothetical protein